MFDSWRTTNGIGASVLLAFALGHPAWGADGEKKREATLTPAFIVGGDPRSVQTFERNLPAALKERGLEGANCRPSEEARVPGRRRAEKKGFLPNATPYRCEFLDGRVFEVVASTADESVRSDRDQYQSKSQSDGRFCQTSSTKPTLNVVYAASRKGPPACAKVCAAAGGLQWYGPASSGCPTCP